jgi:hypothetical protein
MTFSALQLFLLIVLLALAVLFLLRQHIPWLRYAAACKKWPRVTGRIVDSPTSDDSTDGQSRAYHGGRAQAVLYSYSVDGKEYEGDNISFDAEIRRNPALMGKAAEMYEIGEEVLVYYDPKNPHISVLRP